MSKDHLPQAKLDSDLVEHLHARHEVDYNWRYAVIPDISKINQIDDRNLIWNETITYRYANKVILDDQGIYLLNRLYAYYRDYSGVAHLNDWHHIHALIKTYPILQELWDQFETAVVLCSEHEKVKRGQL